MVVGWLGLATSQSWSLECNLLFGVINFEAKVLINSEESERRAQRQSELLQVKALEVA